ncbi:MULTISPECIES: substrate-binding domain-containing protein [Terrisporobacter]|uniref:Excisionase n=2 Tax=Terrisporobacter TaxID=1505652 RepID=A0A0B3VK96_9FIRM|nr:MULTISPECIES: helix-turn-helix transcriptional regulator [Terrisporobacter]KHS57201.1 excisionase [Terrisporobacter othiniensis]MCC3668491.1 helix-turn-helix transcriptional regulator [Terrisporobacter mayombei]MCR1821947.1 helix-turn-helix transcriptional regulator [Terrisporobacter muris]MDU6985066.1 helix-turn-helix transcriptional regulator [Terrisporobacter othiniensis]MDY3371842.1 helix-turn-helix transcriptional regulator [Terrisporobacter othiniensis]
MNSSLNAMEVAQMLNITKNTVYEMIKRGELPSYKVGRKIRIDKTDVENYINNQKNTFTNKPILSLEPTINIKSSSVKSGEIIISGQDIILDILCRMIESRTKNIRTYRSNIGSYNGLYDMYNNNVSISSCHLWDSETDTYNTNFVKKLLPGVSCTLINIAYRMQGFYVKSGNPKNIKTWNDLNRSDITMINREKGSGVRVLLDGKLNSLNLSNNIKGYENEETSHLSVASCVARGDADVGIGNEKVSKQVDNIDFIPLQKERYDLVIKSYDLNNPIYKSIVDILSSKEFKSELEGLGGYDLKDTGKIVGQT